VPAGNREIVLLAGVIDKMTVDLRRQIERLVAERVDARAALVLEVAKRTRAEAALRRLNLALEDQAKRVAADLHAEAGQFLAVAHLGLADLAPELSPPLRERLRNVQTNLESVENSLRDVAHELRPRLLEDLGLVGGLEFLAKRVTRRSGIAVTVEFTGSGRLDQLVETTIYRVAQEALTNVATHSRARRAEVKFRQDEHAVRGAVVDDGCGFDVAAVEARPGSSLGLCLIRDRLEAIHGRVEIASAPGRGTAVRVTVPLEHDDAAPSTAR
jgi:signal transduction histidine kinase